MLMLIWGGGGHELFLLIFINHNASCDWLLQLQLQVVNHYVPINQLRKSLY